MRAVQVPTGRSKRRWIPFVALVGGAIFLSLLSLFSIPSKREAAKSSPAPNVLTHTELRADNDERKPLPLGPLPPVTLEPSQPPPTEPADTDGGLAPGEEAQPVNPMRGVMMPRPLDQRPE
jgi:hypothetical protein